MALREEEPSLHQREDTMNGDVEGHFSFLKIQVDIHSGANKKHAQ